ncbi:hypothetical protein ACJX0J_038171, partial [Zea mays]
PHEPFKTDVTYIYWKHHTNTAKGLSNGHILTITATRELTQSFNKWHRFNITCSPKQHDMSIPAIFCYVFFSFPVLPSSLSTMINHLMEDTTLGIFTCDVAWSFEAYDLCFVILVDVHMEACDVFVVTGIILYLFYNTVYDSILHATLYAGKSKTYLFLHIFLMSDIQDNIIEQAILLDLAFVSFSLLG